jgi:HlyD family secretion protein
MSATWPPCCHEPRVAVTTVLTRVLRPLRIAPTIAIVVVVLVAALLLLRRCQGPELPGYELTARPLVQNVVATGRVITTSRAQVGSEITGTVRERRVAEGDRVSPGDVLIVLRADDLTAKVREAEAALRQLESSSRPQAQAALRQAEAKLAQASRERQRRTELFARQLVAREALEQAEEAEAVAQAVADQARLAAQASAPGRTEEIQLRERLQAARAQLAKTTIRAEVAGTVLTRNVEPGDLVQPGRMLLEIARSGDTEIEVPVDEKNLSTLAAGQRAQCLADAFPAQAFPAVVNYIAPSIDAQRGTVNIRLKVDPVPAFLRQDMTVSVTVETGRRDQAIAVPNDALLDAEGPAPAVLLVREGRVRRTPVQLGLRGLAASEVTSGLAAGDLVLASAQAVVDVKAGDRVRVTAQPVPGPASDAASRRELPVSFD